MQMQMQMQMQMLANVIRTADGGSRRYDRLHRFDVDDKPGNDDE